jgi:hypothetical protein
MRIAGLLLIGGALWGAALDDATRQLSRDIFRELIEINTTDSVGNTTLAAEAMAKRLKDAGFPAADIQVLGPNDRKGNLVARLRGAGGNKPVLIIGLSGQSSCPRGINFFEMWRVQRLDHLSAK